MDPRVGPEAQELLASRGGPDAQELLAPRGGHDGAVLRDVAALRTRTRRATGSPCWSALCFGVTTVLCALVLRAFGAGAFVIAWLAGGALTTAFVGRLYRRLGQQLGLAGRRRATAARSWAMCAAVFAAAALAGTSGGPVAAVVTSIVVVVGGYGLIARWRREPGLLVAALGAAAPALALAAAGGTPWLIELTFGVVLIATGATLYVRDERR